ncbi:MAG: glycosyltransferase family 2 protein [Clostridia bacterium]|nr:glycosyltransferase family 2 protein [Clostridia bacterium]
MISVIIPMYNAGRTIRRCLQSVLDQSYRDIEIIVIDDGSKDDGAQIVSEMARDDSRIRLISQANGGVSSARNRGIDESRGGYICFIDSDDTIEKDYVALLYGAMTDTGSDIVLCGYREEGSGAAKDHILTDEALAKLRGTIRTDFYPLREFTGSPCMKLYSAGIIRDHSLRFREDMVTAEDQLFNYQYDECCETIAFVNRPAYVYHVDASNLSRKRTRQCLDNEIVKISYGIASLERQGVEDRDRLIAGTICYAARQYLFLTDEKNTPRACRERLKSLNLLRRPVRLQAWENNLIYRLLCRRLYTVLCAYLWLRKKLRG